MTTLLIIAALGVAAWYVLSGTHRNHVQDPSAMSPQDLVRAYADLKRRILETSAYENELRYKQLYGRMKGIARTVLLRHAHFVLDPIASRSLSRAHFSTTYFGIDEAGRKSAYLYLPADSESKMSNDAVLAAAILFWHGNHFTSDLGEIMTDRKRAKQLINHLVNDRDYAPALLFKGMMAKYGDEVFTAIRWDEAYQSFTEAKRRGVGSAEIEMEGMNELKSLDGIKGVNSD